MIREDYTHNDTKKPACHHLADDEDFVRRLVQETLNEVLESEMTEFLGAGKSEPDADASLKAFAERELEEPYPYVLLDARYEKVREEGSVRSRAVQIAIGIDGEGRRQVLAAEVANRESEVSWTAFLSHLKERGLRGVEYVVSDSHEGLKHAISKVLPTALWQRCCVHFLRNARDKLSRSADPACLEGLKRLWGCEHVGEAREALGAWVTRWGDEKGFGRLVEWVEDHVEETLTVYRLPREHRLRMKSTNMLERYNEELRPADYTHLPLDFYLSGRNSVYSYRRSRVLSAGRGG